MVFVPSHYGGQILVVVVGGNENERGNRGGGMGGKMVVDTQLLPADSEIRKLKRCW